LKSDPHFHCIRHRRQLIQNPQGAFKRIWDLLNASSNKVFDVGTNRECNLESKESHCYPWRLGKAFQLAIPQD
jgi:hypothetical protein